MTTSSKLVDMSPHTLSTASNPALTIVCISDLHTLPLPSSFPPGLGDILIVAGDLSEGTPSQLQSRLHELENLRSIYAQILVIAGNHDRALDPSCDKFDASICSSKDLAARATSCRSMYRKNNHITYLENSGGDIIIRGHQYKVWGSPGSLATSKRTAFGYTAEGAAEYWSYIPSDVDILITHGPPVGYLDAAMGCLALRDALWRVKPRAHVFGHVHQARGTAVLRYDQAQTIYEGLVSAALTEKMRLVEGTSRTDGLYIPRCKRAAEVLAKFDLPASLGYSEDLPKRGETVLVNAAYKGRGESFGAVVVHCEL